MIYLTEKAIQSNIKKFGFKSCESAVVDKVNEYVDNFAHNTVAKVTKKYRSIEVVEDKHVQVVQSGGRVVLPSEYFGINSGKYSSSVPSFTSSEISNAFLRAPVLTQDLQGLITGGSATKKLFALPKKAVKNAIQEAQVRLQHQQLKFRASAVEGVADVLSRQMTDILIKAQKSKKGDTHLTVEDIEKATGAKKYQSLTSKL